MLPERAKWIFLFVLLCLLVSSASAWLAGYDYRQKHNITGDASWSGDLSNYQVMFVVDTGVGVSSGNTVYLNSKSEADLDDLRFTDTSDTVWDYWIEEATNTSTQYNVWVEYPSIDNSTTATQCYVYYGNSGASAYSNITNTMDFGDDFPGDVVNYTSNKWTVSAGTPEVSSSILTLNGVEAIDDANAAAFGIGYTLEAWIKPTHTAIDNYNWQMGFSGTGGYDVFEGKYPAAANKFGHETYNTAGTGQAFTGTYTNAAYHRFKIRRTSASASDAWIDSETHTKTDQISSVNAKAHLLTNHANEYILCDWVFIHKFITAGSEPAHSTWYAEECSGGCPPVAAFSANVTSGYVPLTVSFTDASSNTPTSWYWEFGDGDTSTDQNPVHEYTDGGLFTVNLKASNAAGEDWENKTSYIMVGDSTYDYCKPITINSTTGATLTNYQVSYTLYNTSGSSSGNTIYLGSHVYSSSWADIQFTDHVGTNISFWVGGMTATSVVVWVKVPSIAADNTTQILLKSGNYLSSSNSNTNTFDFIDDFEVHSGTDDAAGSKSVLWDDFSVNGGYVFVRTGAAYSGTHDQYLRPSEAAPLDSFGVLRTTSTFTNNGRITFYCNRGNANSATNIRLLDASDSELMSASISTAAGSWVLYSWDTHAYSGTACKLQIEGGTYQNGWGWASEFDYMFARSYAASEPDSYPEDIECGTGVVAEFSANVTAGTNPLTVLFTDLSSGSPTNWSWDFGDTGTSTDQNPVHTYTSFGTFTVKLNASKTGEYDWENKTDYITVSGTSGCNRIPITINSTTGATITDYQINYILYNTTGSSSGNSIYLGSNVSWNDLSFTTYDGEEIDFWRQDDADTATSTSIWAEVPSVLADNTTQIYLYYGNNTFATSGSNGDNTFLFFDDFDSPSTSINTTKWATHTGVSVSGSVVHVESPNAWTDGTLRSSTTVSYNTAMQFRNKFNCVGGIYDYAIGYGTGTYGVPKATLQAEPFGYNRLYMTTHDGTNGASGYIATIDNSSYHYTKIERESTTLVDFWIDATHDWLIWWCPPQSLPAQIEAPPYGGDWHDVDWVFVRNWVSSEPTSYPNASESMCAVTSDFSGTPTTGSPAFNVTFTEESVDATSWYWDFGDGETSTDQNPTHTYNDVIGNTPTSYTVCLNSSGADNYAWENKTDYITAYPVLADFSANVTSGMAPLAVGFTNLSGNSPTNWYWEFGDGNTSTSENPENIYSLIGLYTVKLNASNAYSYGWENKTDYIEVTPIYANFSANVTDGIAGQYIGFTDLSEGVVTSWLWDFGDGGNSTDANPVHVYSLAGVYNVSLFVSGPSGSDWENKTEYISIGGSSIYWDQDTYVIDEDANITYSVNRSAYPVWYDYLNIYTIEVAPTYDPNTSIETWYEMPAWGESVDSGVETTTIANPPYNLSDCYYASLYSNGIFLHDMCYVEWGYPAHYPLYYLYMDEVGDDPCAAVQITEGGTHGGNFTVSAESMHCMTGHYDTNFEIHLVNATTFEWWFYWNHFDGHWSSFEYRGVEVAYLPGVDPGEIVHGYSELGNRVLLAYDFMCVLGGNDTILWDQDYYNINAPANITYNASGSWDPAHYTYSVEVVPAYAITTTIELWAAATATGSKLTTISSPPYYPNSMYYALLYETEIANATNKILLAYDSMNTTVNETPAKFPPHSVRFVLQDYFGAPLNDVWVYATPIETTLGSWSWLGGLFGMNITETNYVNTTMNGSTGLDGSIDFIMYPTIKYNITCVGGTYGINYQTAIYPQENEIYLHIPTLNAPNTSSSVTYTTINSTFTPDAIGGVPGLNQWLALGTLLLVGTMFSKKSVKVAAVIVPLFGLFFYYIDWLEMNTMGLSILVSLLALGILSYARKAESVIGSK